MRKLLLTPLLLTLATTANANTASDATSIKTLHNLCEQKHMVACNNLGSLYFSGKGVTKDLQKAEEHFQQSCDAGITESCTNLGYLYHEQGTEEGYKKSIPYLTNSCDQKIYLACFWLGFHYFNGHVIEHSPDKAISLWKEACKNDIDIACKTIILNLTPISQLKEHKFPSK